MAAKSDQRKHKKTKALVPRNLHSGSGKVSRSQRKSQWTEFYDDDEDQWCEDWDEEWQMESAIQAQWDEIRQAVDENNADLLYGLLPPVNLFNSTQKYWSRGCYWRHSSPGNDLLRRAADLEHVDCVDVILDKIRSKDLPSYIVDHTDWRTGNTALVIACQKGNLKIVQMLIERGHARHFRSTGFFIAFDRGDESLMNYLISRCDLRTSVHQGRTALDCLISRGYLEIAKRLICHGDTQRNSDGFSPMMLAVHHDLSSLVDLLFERLPRQEALDELTLLACHYTITGDTQNREKAFDLFVRGLNQEESTETGVPHEVYESHRECKTTDELEAIRIDENALQMHSLIVSERILLRLGDVDPLLKLIDWQCNFYRSNGLFHRSLQLRMHADHLVNQHQFNGELLYGWQLRYFDELIRDVDRAWKETRAVPIELIEMVSTNLFDNDDKNFVLSHMFDLLATIVYMIQSTTTKSDERRSLFNIARRAMQYDTMGNSLLVHYINSNMRNWNTHDFALYNVTPLSMIQFMVQCGANVDGIYRGWNITRPLHTIASYYSDIAKPIIELLLAHGAHADCIDENGRLPQDRAREPTIKELLSPTRNLSLKCRCAQIIVSKRIKYRHRLSSNLLAFIQLHTNEQTI